jgi:hypothetical protein
LNTDARVVAKILSFLSGAPNPVFPAPNAAAWKLKENFRLLDFRPAGPAKCPLLRHRHAAIVPVINVVDVIINFNTMGGGK